MLNGNHQKCCVIFSNVDAEISHLGPKKFFHFLGDFHSAHQIWLFMRVFGLFFAIRRDI